MKKVMIGFILGLILGSATYVFGVQKPVKLIINGREITTDVQPQINNGRVMVPVRPFAEALGAKVQWVKGTNSVVIDSNIQGRVEVLIEPGISKYGIMMSSVPGFPLHPSFTSRIPENVKYHWFTDKGTFLNWQNSKVDSLGKDMVVPDPRKIYWSPDEENRVVSSVARVYLKIEDSDTGQLVAESNIEIHPTGDGFFTVK